MNCWCIWLTTPSAGIISLITFLFWRVHVNKWALAGASCRPGTISEFAEARQNQIWRELRVCLKENWRKNWSEKTAQALIAVPLLAVRLETPAVGALRLVPLHSVNPFKKLRYLGRLLTSSARLCWRLGGLLSSLAVTWELCLWNRGPRSTAAPGTLLRAQALQPQTPLLRTRSRARQPASSPGRIPAQPRARGPSSYWKGAPVGPREPAALLCSAKRKPP